MASEWFYSTPPRQGAYGPGSPASPTTPTSPFATLPERPPDAPSKPARQIASASVYYIDPKIVPRGPDEYFLYRNATVHFDPIETYMGSPLGVQHGCFLQLFMTDGGVLKLSVEIQFDKPDARVYNLELLDPDKSYYTFSGTFDGFALVTSRPSIRSLDYSETPPGGSARVLVERVS